MTATPDGLAAPEYYVLQPGKEFIVGLPDETHLKICTPLEGLWEIRRYDDQSDRSEAFDRVDLRRIRPVPGEPTEPIQPPTNQI